MIHRRHFLHRTALAGAAGWLGLRPEPARANPSPETATIRLVKFPGICLAPQYVAEGLLRAEGFADVQYISTATGDMYDAIDSGEIDRA